MLRCQHLYILVILLATLSCRSTKVPVSLPATASFPVPRLVSADSSVQPATKPALPQRTEARAGTKISKPASKLRPPLADTSQTRPPLPEDYPRDKTTLAVNVAGGTMAAAGSVLLGQGLRKHETWTTAGAVGAGSLLLVGLLLMLYQRHRSRRRQLRQAIKAAYPGKKTDFFAMLLKVTGGIVGAGGLLLAVASLGMAMNFGILLGLLGAGLGLGLLLLNDPGSLRGHWHEEVRQYRQTQRRQRRRNAGS